MATDAYDQPLSVEVFDGEVVVRAATGPMAIALTPRAAAATAEQLAQAAERATAQVQGSQTGSLCD
jgi:hypothetical protein